MPYKTGKLKGQLTSAELRKLIKAHNKLYTIKVPSGSTQPEIVKLINDNGYNVNHKKQSLFLAMKNLPRKITMDDVPKKVEPTALQKQKRQEAKEIRLKKQKQEIRQAKIGAVKKFQKANPPQPKQKPIPVPKAKPEPKSEPKPKQEPIVKKKPISDKPKPKRKQLGNTQKPSSTITQKVLPTPPPKKPAKPSGKMVRKVHISMALPASQAKNASQKSLYTLPNGKSSSKDAVITAYDKLNVDVVFSVGGMIGLEETKRKQIDQGRTLYDGNEKQPLVKLNPIKTKKRQAKQPLGSGNAQQLGVKPLSKMLNKQEVQKTPDIKDIKVIKVNNDSYPLKVSEYPDVRNIPFEDIWNNLVDKRSNVYFPFSGFRQIKDILYFSILNDNENICALPKKYHDKIVQLGTLTDLKSIKGKPKEWTSYRNPSMMLNRLRGIIATRFLSCASMNETLAIPISLSGGDEYNSYHANMLIFNPYSWEVEHYEPHGEKYQGQWLGHNQTGKSKKKSDGFWVPDGINFKQAIENINKEIKRQFKLNSSIRTPEKRKNVFSQMTSNSRSGTLKYLPPNEVCPTPSLIGKLKSFQSDEGFSAPKLFEGAIITETNGYCALWSMYFLDLRLKTMKQPVQKIYEMMATELDKEYKKSSQKYIELIRGVSKYGWEKMKILATPKYTTTENIIKYTKKDLLEYLAGEDDTPKENQSAVSRAINKLISELQGEISSKYGKQKLKYKNTLNTKYNFNINPTTDPLTQNINPKNISVAKETDAGGVNMLVELKGILMELEGDYDFISSVYGKDFEIKKVIAIESRMRKWDNTPINKIPKADRLYMYKMIKNYIDFRKLFYLNDSPMRESISDDQVLEYITKYFK
mgnify:CR=1 FL=1